MRRSLANAMAFVVLATSQSALADKGPVPLTIAEPERSPEPNQDEHPQREPPGDASYVEDGAGPRLSFGRAFHQDIPDGWYGRFETEYFEQHAQGYRRRRGSLWGMRLGLEGWGSSEDWGAGLPVSAYGGYRQPLFRADRGLDLFGAVGVGVDVFSFDRVEDESGVGLFTPRAEAVLGFDFGGVRLLADGGVQYRWHFSQGDFLQLRAGIALSLHAELWDG